MSEQLIEVEELRKVFRVKRDSGIGRENFTALKGVSFSIERGGSLAIVGESGSGKSTAARIIVGLETATSGDVRVQGKSWNPERKARSGVQRERGKFVQMIFQDPYQSLNRRYSVHECLDEVLRLHTKMDRDRRADRISELLESVKLTKEQGQLRPRALSGGQRQRVAIARALAVEPQLLILDEAVSALDVSVQAQVLTLLEGIREETGVAFLFISHDLPVAQRVCDDVLVMRHGEVVEQGDVHEVLSNPQEAYTRRLIASVPRRGWKPRRWLNTSTVMLPDV